MECRLISGTAAAYLLNRPIIPLSCWRVACAAGGLRFWGRREQKIHFSLRLPNRRPPATQARWRALMLFFLCARKSLSWLRFRVELQYLLHMHVVEVRKANLHEFERITI